MLKKTLKDTSVGFDPSMHPPWRARFAAKLFFLGSTVCLISLSWSILCSNRVFWAIIEWYQYTFIYRLWYWGGIRYRVKGEIPKGGIIIASKHQSIWETQALNHILDRPAFIFKAELMRIPFWGRILIRMDMCSIDRKGGISAMRKLYEATERTLSNARPLIIFPEGTRIPPGESAPLRSGVYGIYHKLNHPVVPLALNSGMVWPRKKSPRPGIIDLEFLPPIKPGLDRKAFEARLSAAINKPIG